MKKSSKAERRRKNSVWYMILHRIQLAHLQSGGRFDVYESRFLRAQKAGVIPCGLSTPAFSFD